MRALAAAPSRSPPERSVTAMVIQLGEAAPAADQLASIQRLAEPAGGKISQRDAFCCVEWSDPMHAASCAIELRDVLGDSPIAIATGTAEGVGPKSTESIVSRALAMLKKGGPR